jgi:fumarylpyruvate hydrolase
MCDNGNMVVPRCSHPERRRLGARFANGQDWRGRRRGLFYLALRLPRACVPARHALPTPATLPRKRYAIMIYAFPPISPPTLPIQGSDKVFPIHRIYCVGRNYADHAVEMGHDPKKEPPFFFQKNADNVRSDGTFPYPAASTDVHFEIELVVALKSGGVDIKPSEAMAHVFGYAVGIDMTRRDLQAQAKKLQRPWEVGKAFEHSAPCSALVLAQHVDHPRQGAIWLDVNGMRKQTGDLNQMIWDIPHQLAFLSGLFELKAGDLIFTGTPAGVGAIKKGDLMQGHIDGIADLEVRVI